MNTTQIKQQVQKGFTLIELMIVVAIIGILAAVALPQYSAFTKKSAEGACMAEAKGYANTAASVLNDIPAGTPATPVASACTSISTPTATSTPVVAVSKSPGTRGISCDMTSGSCAYTGT